LKWWDIRIGGKVIKRKKKYEERVNGITATATVVSNRETSKQPNQQVQQQPAAGVKFGQQSTT
jgi:hypothetical protein